MAARKITIFLLRGEETLERERDKRGRLYFRYPVKRPLDNTRSASEGNPCNPPDPVYSDHPFAVPAITQRVFHAGTRFIVYFRVRFLRLEIDRRRNA